VPWHPVDPVFNSFLIRSCPALGIVAHFNRSLLLGLILPGLQFALLVVAAIGRW
jgi:hypothetical protein